MATRQQIPSNNLDSALARYRNGFDPARIELTEREVFPYLIPCATSSGRKARSTGLLLGRPGPRFIRRNRSIFYRLSDVLDWLAEADEYTSTAAVVAREAGQ